MYTYICVNVGTCMYVKYVCVKMSVCTYLKIFVYANMCEHTNEDVLAYDNANTYTYIYVYVYKSNNIISL